MFIGSVNTFVNNELANNVHKCLAAFTMQPNTISKLVKHSFFQEWTSCSFLERWIGMEMVLPSNPNNESCFLEINLTIIISSSQSIPVNSCNLCLYLPLQIHIYSRYSLSCLFTVNPVQGHRYDFNCELRWNIVEKWW